MSAASAPRASAASVRTHNLAKERSMAFQSRATGDIAEQDLLALINDRVPEDRTLDYKAELPGSSNGARREFVADVTSFANTNGGHSLYGMDEEQGIATALIGLPNLDPDAEVLRLEGILANGCEPRIPGLTIRAIPVTRGDVAILVAIPRSWARPHQDKVDDDRRFYGRNAGGKYRLDVAELRSLFSVSEGTGQRIRQFQAKRLAAITSGETPVPLRGYAKVILHVIPFGAFDTGSLIDPATVRDRYAARLYPLYSTGYNHRYNFDGVITFSGDSPGDLTVTSYLQLFRDGSIETVTTGLFDEDYVPSAALERVLIESVGNSLALQESLILAPPALVTISIVGIEGFRFIVGENRRLSSLGVRPIEEVALHFPDIIVENMATPPAALLRPIFDALWNAAGLPRALSYDDATGEYVG